MAGAVDKAPNSIGPHIPAPETPSVPLYIAGLIITLCGIVAANAALPQPDVGWLERTVLLSGLGFLFSYGCRYLGIKPQGVDFGFAAVILLLLVGIVGGKIVLEQFLPMQADSPSLRLLSALVWGGTLWAWALRSDNRVLGTAVPTMAILGLAASVDLNNPVLVCFGIFTLTVIFLLIHQNYLQNMARAAIVARKAASPRLLLAQFAQAGLCGLAVLLAGLIVIVPAQALFAHLSLAQAIRRLAVIRPGPSGGMAALRFSDDDNLAIGTGTAWSASAEVVMQVRPSDGQEHYWRGRTYDLYTGDGWQSSLENQKTNLVDAVPIDPYHLSFAVRPDLTPGDIEDSTIPLMTTTFRVFGDTNQFYYAADPRQIILETDTVRYGQGVRACLDGRLDLTDRRSYIRFPYAIVSRPAPDATQSSTQDHLRQAGQDYPPEVRELYLDPVGRGITQPEDQAFFRQALAEALKPVPPDRRDPLDEALAIRAWVSQRCVYSLAPAPIPSESDHVRVFLRDARRGYCDMFASSMAILCRMAGIPARLATGFAPGDPQGDSFSLRAEDKHAWTEVYFPGSGWVAFDATAGSLTDGSIPNGQGRGRGSWLTWLSRLRAGLGAGWQLVTPLLGLILLIIGYVLKTEVYDRWRLRRKSSGLKSFVQARPRTALGRQYTRLTRALARLGLPRRSTETPAEYAARVVPLLAALQRELGVTLSPPLVPALTDAFTQACYGGADAFPIDAEQWERPVSQLESAARRVVWIRLWRKMTGNTDGTRLFKAG